MQHKEDIEVKTPEADGEAAPVDWKLARSLVEPLYLDQKLYTGEPRLAHADGMAEILKGVRNDDELIVAAYLFSVTDCIHDADRWIEKTFGKNVLQLVRDLEQLMHVSQRARSDNRACFWPCATICAWWFCVWQAVCRRCAGLRSRVHRGQTNTVVKRWPCIRLWPIVWVSGR